MNSEEHGILNYDVWGYLTKKFNISPEKKLKIFLILVLIISGLLEIVIWGGIRNLPDNINSYTLAISTLLWLMGMAINYRAFYKIKEVRLWEIIMGIVVIISSFTIVTPIKHIYFPDTRIFGVLNGGMFIFGVFLIFYGVRKYQTIISYGLLYGIFIILNFLWNVLGRSAIGINLATASSRMAYGMLRFFGYPVYLQGTTITIITINGSKVSATIAGLCSGVEGITFSIVILILLFMGSYISYRLRIIAITLAAIVMFFLNVLRICLIFVTAYYYGQQGLQEAHAWLGNVISLLFIIPYWYLVDLKFNKSPGSDNHEKAHF